jgi:hypothetical protein
MALGGVDMFFRLGGLHYCRVEPDKPFLLFTRKTMHDFDAKRLIAGVGGWVVLVWLGLVDQIWPAGGLDAMSFSCEDLIKITFTRGGEEDGIGICRYPNRPLA